ncbi:hypothetical protein HDU83_001733 [Entophlyctis luteolus]|nr:hypothetical protein HDU82_002870 [Entophlyctis luteolus]KAJ3356154.1 hypothetical protein HDU83_001733 [Entophlyctis luteolus]KAJ3394083.1 hypothetical protein HDU84_000111 [Entophlyctis sp. JEL0112]
MVVPAPQNVAAALAVLVPAIYFAAVLADALASTPLSLEPILANAWATSALVDYATALPFVVPYVFYRAPSSRVGVLLALGCVLLGNVFTVPVFVVFLLRGQSLKAALLPGAAAAPGATASSSLLLPVSAAFPARSDWLSRKSFVTLTATVLMFYTVIVANALATESPGEGYEYIISDKWSYVTFVDVLVGIQLVALYIFVREANTSVLAAVLWVLALELMGNGVTCAYILYLAWKHPAVGGVAELLLGSVQEGLNQLD